MCGVCARVCERASVSVSACVHFACVHFWFAAYEIILADKKWKSDEKLWQFCAPLLFYRILAAVV